jgi:hypothetical protein
VPSASLLCCQLPSRRVCSARPFRSTASHQPSCQLLAQGLGGRPVLQPRLEDTGDLNRHTLPDCPGLENGWERVRHSEPPTAECKTRRHSFAAGLAIFSLSRTSTTSPLFLH